MTQITSTAASSDELATLAPYEGEAFRDALRRLLEHPLLPHIVHAYFPQMPMAQVIGCAEPLRGADDFQRAFIDPLIRTLLQKTSTGISVGGLERLKAGVEHVFLSTHRDIVLDPGLFAWTLFHGGRRTCRICL